MIYLLHSTVPLGGTGKHSARHYLGYAPDATWRKRIDAHRAGRSNVKIVDAFIAQGARLLLVALLPGGTRTDERKLKEMGHMARFCPICNDKRSVGWPDGLVAIIPRRRASTLLSAKPVTASGGDSPPHNSTLATSPDGASPLEPFQVLTTPYGVNAVGLPSGGTLLTVTVPPSPVASTPCAGTKQRSTFVESTSREGAEDAS